MLPVNVDIKILKSTPKTTIKTPNVFKISLDNIRNWRNYIGCMKLSKLELKLD